MLDVYFRVSTHLLRLEAARDGVALGRAAIANNCDPAASGAVYESIDGGLTELISEAMKMGVDDHSVARLHDIRADWKALRKRRVSLWAETERMHGNAPVERCMRASDLVDTRMAIERNFSAVMKSAIRENAR